MTVSKEADSVELLWGERGDSTRAARPALSLEVIAQAATNIADVDGIDSVSMQRVASELGFTKMSLYRYVASKAELISVMIDRTIGDPPRLDAIAGGWRAKLQEFARLLAETWQQHPWLPWATMGNRLMGPREVGWVDSAVAAFDGTGLTGTERLDATFLLFGHIRNTQSMATAGTQSWTTDRRISSTMAKLMSRYRARFPALTAAIDAANDGRHDNGRQFGLELIFNGLAALVDQREAQHPEARA
jgi:AcrR family transcriptional regulator